MWSLPGSHRDAASDRTCLLKIADRGAETRLAHRIRGTHGHGGLSRTREGLMTRNRRQFLPHLESATLFALTSWPMPGDSAKLSRIGYCGLTKYFLEGD